MNRDGRLSKLELTKASAVLGMNPTEKDINDMMREVDTDSKFLIMSLNKGLIFPSYMYVYEI